MHLGTSHPSHSARAHRTLTVTSLALLAGLSACNGDALNLGNDEAPLDEGDGSCSIDVSSSGSIFALNQADVDALSGCRELPGTLYIRVPAEQQATFTLAALADLEVVHGLLSIVGPLESLAGLDSLEQVASLELEGLRAPDLTPLGSLARVQRGGYDARARGIINIAECHQLTDLSGLENLTTWSSLNLTNLNGLETLAGLQAPPLVDTISIYGAPRLSDVSALASVESVDELGVSDTVIRNFAGFRLDAAGSIWLASNHALTDLDGLSELRSVENLSVNDNDALVRVELPALIDLQSIRFTGNAVLQAVPYYEANTGNLQQPEANLEPYNFRFSRTLFEVGDNPALESIVMPTQYSDFDQVAIYGNASLTSLDMGFLGRSGNIWIVDNAVLATIAAPYLERVGDLAVRNNPALSVTPFANVQTFSRDMTGNLDAPAP